MSHFVTVVFFFFVVSDETAPCSVVYQVPPKCDERSPAEDYHSLWER